MTERRRFKKIYKLSSREYHKMLVAYEKHKREMERSYESTFSNLRTARIINRKPKITRYKKWNNLYRYLDYDFISEDSNEIWLFQHVYSGERTTRPLCRAKDW